MLTKAWLESISRQKGLVQLIPILFQVVPLAGAKTCKYPSRKKSAQRQHGGQSCTIGKGRKKLPNEAAQLRRRYPFSSSPFSSATLLS